MFEPSAEQQTLIEAAATAARSVLGATLKEDDEAERFRKSAIAELGENGLCGVQIPEAFGGLGLGYLDYAMVLEQIARVSASYGVSVAVTGLPQVILLNFGDAAQQAAWMPGLASGQLLGAFALSEPGSGSDAAALLTTARREGDTYVLNGTKFWITHGGYADIYVVMARTGGPGPKGISAFLVPGDAAGLRFGKKEEKMGLRASPTVELILEDVVVPVSDDLNPEEPGEAGPYKIGDFVAFALPG
jgi:alkylation response protein AidB-like acyl-CoA dehydrogenase